MQLDVNLMKALVFVTGMAMFALGVSFFWKFFQAAFLGKVAYWTGLERFGFFFMPITLFISPLLIHMPYDVKKTLIAERQQLWVHLFFGPVFFVLALMSCTTGADFMGLPGSTSLNTILTLGRSDVPPCIVYSPPDPDHPFSDHFPYVQLNYRFPFLKKATRTVIKGFTSWKFHLDKKDSYNAYEQRGDVDVEEYSKVGPGVFYDDEEKQEALRAQAAAEARANGGSSHRKK